MNGKWIHLEGARCAPLPEHELRAFETLDTAYRALCAMLYNYAPLSGHPGGSISSGRIVEQLLFGTMDYDVARPDRDDADVLSYAAGHKALGLYAILALQNEIVRLTNASFLPRAEDQLRFEDLLGFRRNPTNATPLFRRHGAKALDGHPTPATPFVRLSTGASGVGIGSSFGLALAAFDWFGDAAPRVHVMEGEGGLTPGRVAEALAFAGTAALRNVVVHVDWNQASIDSDRVTREGTLRGDYVQWEPAELFHLHDWNVIVVPDGSSFAQRSGARSTSTTISRPRSSTAPRKVGSTASKEARRTARGTSSARPRSSARCRCRRTRSHPSRHATASRAVATARTRRRSSIATGTRSRCCAAGWSGSATRWRSSASRSSRRGSGWSSLSARRARTCRRSTTSTCSRARRRRRPKSI
jgi:transketolase N-terminal domain/subunit